MRTKEGKHMKRSSFHFSFKFIYGLAPFPIQSSLCFMHSPKVKIAPSSKSDESSQASLIRTDLRYLMTDENHEEAPRNLVSLL